MRKKNEMEQVASDADAPVVPATDEGVVISDVPALGEDFWRMLMSRHESGDITLCAHWLDMDNFLDWWDAHRGDGDVFRFLGGAYCCPATCRFE